MYQALYRKYRPKTLDDIYGQDTIVKIIKNSIKNNQINHAYLFAGPRGTGKTSIAKIYAKIVNCENPNQYIPCGKCASCTEINNSDTIEIDAASNNGVDEIRELRNKVNLVPSYGKYKIYIIDEVHMLTVGAFNALLKTLEEPPSHAIFILATTDPQKIPETILSRCQRFDFQKISNDAIVENLKKISEKEKIDIDEEALYEIARLSDGGMRDSVGMLDQAKSYSEDKITIEDIHDINGTITEKDLQQLLKNIEEKNLEEILKKTDKYNEKGKNFTKLIEEFINYLRNVLLMQKVPKYFKEKHPNTQNFEEIVEKITTKDIIKYIETMNKYSIEMKNTSNTKLMFELLFIEIITEKENKNKLSVIEEKEKENQNELENDKKLLKNKEIEQKKEEVLNQKAKKIENNNKIKKIEQIKKIRIDNTLSKFEKKKLLETKKILEEQLKELLVNPEYSEESSMILDGELKAASEENLIFVYKTNRMANLFNENLIKNENTIEEVLNKKYNLIATDIEEWEMIKDDFNNKKRPFIYKEENFNIKELLKQQDDELINMFEDIIEYDK